MSKGAVIESIIMTIGNKKASDLFRDFGGLVIKIPWGVRQRSSTANQLIECIGEDGYEDLIKTFGGERINVPKNKQSSRNDRNRQIVAAYDSGTSRPKLARLYDLTVRQINTILKQPTIPLSAETSISSQQIPKTNPANSEGKA